MAEERALNRQAAPAARRAVGPARVTAAPAASHAPPASRSLQQRLGNQGTRALAAQLVARSAGPAAGPGGCAGCGGLAVSKPGDAMEVEADRVADAVMRMPAAGNAAAGIATDGAAQVIHRQGEDGAVPDTSAPVEANVRTLQGEGSPLPPATREFFESRMGADFSKVRVNTGARATDTAKSLGARAFTVGSSITFGEGQYAPESQEGRKLLAHELTHVVQQDGGGRGGQPAQRAVAVPPISRAAPQLQAAWYNFDMPFTDYQFDPSFQGLKTAAGVVKDAAVDAFNWIVDEIRDAVNSGIAWLKEQARTIQELINSAGAALRSAFNSIISFLLSPFNFFINAFVNLDTDAISRTWAAFSGLVARIANGFKKTIDMFFAPIEKLWRRIDGFATGALNRVEGLLNHWAFRKLPDILQDAARTLVNALRFVWRTISDIVLPLITRIRKWIEGALDVVFGFVRKVLNFGINVIVNGIIVFGKVVLFLRDFFNSPGKYIAILAEKTLPTFSGVEGKFAAKVGEFFGGGRSADATAAPLVKVQRAPDAAADRSSASWNDIGSGVLEVMSLKWREFKSNPLAIVKQLLMDLFLPVVGNVTDVIQLFKDIRDIVTAPLSASSLDEFWTSLLKLLDIPILIYRTVTSILMRTLALPLLLASFVPHPFVKGLAAAVGYALLSMFIQSELMDIGHKVLLLKTGKLTKAEKEKAYNRVGDSIIGLIMTGVIMLVMLILHFIASVVKGIYNLVKGKVFGVKSAPVEAKGPASGEGNGKGKSGPEESRGAEGKGAREGLPSEDGKRRVRINEEGRCEVCASPCTEVRKKYSSVMTPELEGKIKLIEDNISLNDLQKEAKLKPIEQELADLQAKAAGSLVGDLSSLSEAEARFVREQLAQGRKVEIVPTEPGRTPDFRIDGKPVELKTISGVADTTSDGISKAIANRVMNGRGQATDIVVDARGQAGITEEIAKRGVGRAYGADNKTGGKITSIRVIGPGFDITIPRI
jgi:hypothetical protein